MKELKFVLKEEYQEFCLVCPKFDYDFGCCKRITDDDISRCELELAIMRNIKDKGDITITEGMAKDVNDAYDQGRET